MFVGYIYRKIMSSILMILSSIGLLAGHVANATEMDSTCLKQVEKIIDAATIKDDKLRKILIRHCISVEDLKESANTLCDGFGGG